MTPVLFIGNKNYSSWSLRPWLCLKWAEIDFTEKLVDLGQPGYGEGKIAEIVAASPSGRVPAMIVGSTSVWDSLAIAEWAAENTRGPELWPKDPMTRAQARSASAEMHSGFAAVRRDLTMNILRRCPAQDWPSDTRDVIARIEALWLEMRNTYQAKGPWMFGTRSIADAMYAPVATRFRTYSVKLHPIAQSYADQVLNDRDFKAWEANCIPNSWDKPGYPVIDGIYK